MLFLSSDFMFTLNQVKTAQLDNSMLAERKKERGRERWRDREMPREALNCKKKKKKKGTQIWWAVERNIEPPWGLDIPNYVALLPSARKSRNWSVFLPPLGIQPGLYCPQFPHTKALYCLWKWISALCLCHNIMWQQEMLITGQFSGMVLKAIHTSMWACYHVDLSVWVQVSSHGILTNSGQQRLRTTCYCGTSCHLDQALFVKI